MKRPFFKMFPRDYLADTGHLSFEEHGIYCLTLFHLWINNGTINKEKLRKNLKISQKKWKNNLKMLQEFCDDDGENISHKRMLSDIAKYDEICKINAKNAEKGHETQRRKRGESLKQTPEKNDSERNSEGDGALLMQKAEGRSQIKEKEISKEKAEVIVDRMQPEFPHLMHNGFLNLFLLHMKGNKVSTRTERAIHMRLQVLSKYTLEEAMTGLEEAIASGHQGVFPRKSIINTGGNYGRGRQEAFQSSAEKQDDAIAEVERGAREKFIHSGADDKGVHSGAGNNGNAVVTQQAIPARNRPKESVNHIQHSGEGSDHSVNEVNPVVHGKSKRLPQRLRPS